VRNENAVRTVPFYGSVRHSVSPENSELTWHAQVICADGRLAAIDGEDGRVRKTGCRSTGPFENMASQQAKTLNYPNAPPARVTTQLVNTYFVLTCIVWAFSQGMLRLENERAVAARAETSTWRQLSTSRYRTWRWSVRILRNFLPDLTGMGGNQDARKTNARQREEVLAGDVST
jgi:hypothetical protein